MTLALPHLRRIVATNNASGKSYFSEDGDCPRRPENPLNPGAVKYDVWATGPLPVAIDEPDRFSELKGICPLPGGSVLHVLDIPPEPVDPGEREQYLAMRQKDIESRPAMPGVRYHHGGNAYGMHETESVDYAFVLSGEIYAVLDEEERLMKQGDIMIQRGTSHSWINRSGKMCRMAFVIVSGKFVS